MIGRKMPVPIFFTIDDKYADCMAVALYSLMENADPQYNYTVYVIYQDLSDQNRMRIANMCKNNFEIIFRQMSDTVHGISGDKAGKLRCDYSTYTIYYRLFIADMFPQYDKGLYLDSDIVVPGDISELCLTELGDKIFGACADISVSGVEVIANYMENAVGVDRYQYINSGILLMNLKKMREINLSQHFLNLLNTYGFDTIAPDQDYLNAMCSGSILHLDNEWDVMPLHSKPEMISPKIIHYNLFDKPWCYEGVQYETYFWDAASKTPFYEELLAHLGAYGIDRRMHDHMSMEELMKKCREIPDREVTFKKIQNKEGCVKICL